MLFLRTDQKDKPYAFVLKPFLGPPSNSSSKNKSYAFALKPTLEQKSKVWQIYKLSKSYPFAVDPHLCVIALGPHLYIFRVESISAASLGFRSGSASMRLCFMPASIRFWLRHAAYNAFVCIPHYQAASLNHIVKPHFATTTLRFAPSHELHN